MRILFSLFVVLGSQAAYPQQNEIRFDLGVDPFYMVSNNWEPLYSIRGGIGRNINLYGKEFMIHGYLEYTKYQIDEEFAIGVTYILEGTKVKRQDLSLFVTLTHAFVVVGAGLSYVTSTEVTRTDGAQYRESWKYGGLSRLAPYATVGLTTEIGLSSNLSFPFGLHYIHGILGTMRLVTLRVGIAITE